jgi:hypothetical protein
MLGLGIGSPRRTPRRALGDLDLHRSYFQRKAAFDALCRKTGMTLEPG